MIIKHSAAAGTLESCDAVISVAPAQGKSIQVDSAVGALYKDAIIETVEQVLKEYDVSDIQVTVMDRGALDCTLRARTKAALERAMREEQT